ncbi:MAG: hypothetical protein CVV64_04555 [Candidatus Wallbacteria bacterium HGW-Wallbacteria-1]|jgi:uncharacterized membrane protein|uniref:DUF502 domain-containing protein n=1 Tax=Candidatus Wallbacteria bacterium HGW-Wallbacteria-1 TaxID=2013854 RepID=A0A2N1PRS7_9BACT|nr:MAG: hypothetical protein CVV64_04555 [Candidatus Wallbacteria bacterium HGW-Wallbacteria-1]
MADRSRRHRLAVMLIAARLLSRNLVNRLKAYFFTGVIVLLPTGLTIFIVLKIFDFLGASIKYVYGQNMPWWLGTLLTSSIILLSGLFVRNLIGKSMMEVIERIFTRVPFVRSLYSTIKQLIDLIVANKEMMFQKVVLIEYPRKGLYTLGFISAQGPEELCSRTGEKLMAIFISTTPNPTSGFLLFIPDSEVIHLDMTPEEGMKLIISGGIMIPNRQGEKVIGKDQIQGILASTTSNP